MKPLLAIACLFLLSACGSGGPPPPDWKTDSADLIERYKKHALLGENTLAERYFQQAVAATGGAGRVTETARLWLVHCATRRAMLIDDPCAEYADLAQIETNPANHAYFRFLTLQWDGTDIAHLPRQHQDLIRAQPAARPGLLNKVDDPLSRLLQASLLTQRREATSSTLVLAADTASTQGWRQPLLTYLKLQRAQAAHPNDADQLERRIQLIEKSFAPGAK